MQQYLYFIILFLVLQTSIALVPLVKAQCSLQQKPIQISMSFESISENSWHKNLLEQVTYSLPHNSFAIASEEFDTTIQSSFPITTSVGIIALIFAALKLSFYISFQYQVASIISTIPKNFRVCELCANDIKNILYLPSGADYTAILSEDVTEISSKEKREEAIKLQEKLIFESIGRANAILQTDNKPIIKGKIRTSSEQLTSGSFDCVISINGVQRSSMLPQAYFKEAYRLLRPGGLFVFVENDRTNNIISLMKQIFPEVIKLKVPNDNESKLKKAEIVDTETTSRYVEKPGIEFDRISNLNIEPFVVGISVKPY